MNATTWRDLADQLTPQQIATIEYCEREQVPPGIACEESRIRHAQAYVAENEAPARRRRDHRVTV
ncbi:MAG TPA: hypothetical protein PLK19_17720 [Mycobacterium sp.]|nr:hypothetical protein [Mycobacterium sp.]